MTFQLWQLEMHSDFQCQVKPFLFEILTLGFQWLQWEEVMSIDRKPGIEYRVPVIVFQGISQ